MREMIKLDIKNEPDPSQVFLVLYPRTLNFMVVIFQVNSQDSSHWVTNGKYQNRKM